MSSSRNRRQSWAAPGPLSLAFLLALLGIGNSACKKAEPPAEVAPEVTAAEAATTAPAAAATPSPGEEITIEGSIPPQWDPQERSIGPGDTIRWTVGNGKHGLRFLAKADCDLARATMTFDPPLDPIPGGGGGCQSKPKNLAGELIVSAQVTAALTRDLPYDCVVHGTAMPGTLKPK